MPPVPNDNMEKIHGLKGTGSTFNGGVGDVRTESKYSPSTYVW